MLLFFSGLNIVLQTIAHDEMRQRVAGLWSVVFGARFALGRLEADAVEHSVNIKTV
jgi:hypothetical protein